MKPTSKMKKKNIPKSIHEMSKENLQETLKKKRECNAKALMTVEKLCEPNVEEEWFLANLQFINQCHFEDVMIERAITKICGYPLCDQKLDKVSAQQYHISTKYNKVFDITERKNFCSGSCYRSAMYVKNQLFTTPLWFRDQEVIPEYAVLKAKNSVVDKKIAFSPNKVSLDSDCMKRSDCINQTSDINISVYKVEEKLENLKLDNSEKFVLDDTGKLSILKGTELSENKFTKNISNNKINPVKKEKDIHYCPIQSAITEKKMCKNSKDSTFEKSENVKIKGKVKEEPVSIVTKVEKHIFEWFSLNTLFYLYGEEKLKEILQDEAVRVKELLNSKLSMAGYSEKIENLIKLYKLLDIDSLNKNEIKTNLKPLPDYSVLREEGKKLKIKVKAFYQGQWEVKSTQKEENKTDFDPINLPLIDSHSQTALRRKIVLDKLNRMLPDLIRGFSFDYVLQVKDVRDLISTFTLSAHNIIFKHREWCLVGAIIIKLLCLRDKQLESLMNSKFTESQILSILLSYELKEDYLDNLLHRLTDKRNIMKRLNEINK